MRNWTVLVSALALGAFLGKDAKATESKVTWNQLPEEVRRAADEQSHGATVRGYSKETESGQVEYEVEMTVNGHSKDVSIAPDGRVLEVEEEVSLDSLSPQARKGLEAKAGGAKIRKVESLIKNGKLVAFEAQLAKGGKHSEIQVAPDGSPLDHEE